MTKNKLCIILICILTLGITTSSPGKTIPWKGKWIGIKEESKPNTWLCFRKQIDLSKNPQKAIARIACDSKYWLWINDEMVVFEGELKRGPTPEDTYYDQIDLSQYLIKGKNTVAILVWYWGKHGFSHNSSGKAALIFDANIDGKNIISDSSWKVLVHPAFGTTKQPHPNFRLSEPNILFDARNDIKDWYRSSFNDSNWKKAIEFGKPPVSPWNKLEKSPILQWKNTGLLKYTKTETVQNEDGTKSIIGKLPYNCHATPFLKIKAKAGQRIDIQTDNYKSGGPPNIRAVYITRDGVQEYESLGWINGHDMIYKMDKDIEVLEIKYRETGYNADFIGQFKCNDEKLNILWEKARRTLYVTMRDTYMDCPGRERAQWWGDMVNEMGEAFYVFDAEKGPLLAKKGIYELARWQRPDKVIYSPVPAGVPEDPKLYLEKKFKTGVWYRELPCQMLASVGWYGFWTYYWYTGDKQTIIDVYPHVKDYLSLWKLGNDGLVIHREGDWFWGDWGKNKDIPVLENCWVYLAMKGAIEMAKLTGNNKDIPGYQAKMDSIKSKFNKTFWQGDKYRSPDYKDETDDRVNSMAVITGLAAKEYYPAIKKVIENQYHASPYMEKYVLESLYLMDAPQQAIERMKKRWAGQLDSPITTLWEKWAKKKGQVGGGTYNHAWSGGPLTLLCQYSAGVSPIVPGFKKFLILPQVGSLKNIDCIIPTIYGNIELSINKEKSFQMKLDIPEDTSAIVGIPKNINPSLIKINDEIVLKNKKPTDSSTGVKYVEDDGRFIKFSLKSGQWNITAK